MIFVSVTRLRLRSWRFLIPFFRHAAASLRQAKGAPGCLHARVRRTRGLTFWTMTCWSDESSMWEYRHSKAHLKAMPMLAQWCDEAAYANWEQVSSTPPDWQVASERLRQTGHLSKVSHPSILHSSGTINTD
ncbi:hypothetical protein QQ056_08835 [Oscillatoria laete-virens NRMC-F 0139]|nr:hypothetical protein [Oscillatoria laete-virens]MDL5053647.1 hypothetical protein [Oscillatoria laete-virens NRMC-F 0139]